MSDLRIPSDLVHVQIALVLRRWGMPEDAVATTARVMTDTDLAGIDSHGISMLMLYEKFVGQGHIRLDARPQVTRDRHVTALVDAQRGFGHPVARMAMELAIAKAEAHGLGAVAVHNSNHFGAAGWYALLAAERGLVGIVTTSAKSISVVPTRAAVPVLGTNPIAFAAPARRNPPFLLDMSTSTVAVNKIKVYGLRGQPLPEGWMLDAQGRPVTDAARAMHHIFGPPDGGITPLGGGPQMGGHKGYGLSAMVQILSSALSGGSFSPLRERMTGGDGPDNMGHFFLALDPREFRDGTAFEDDVDALIDELHATRAIDPARPVLVAGEPERLARADRLARGIPLSPSLLEQLEGVATRAGVEFVLRAANSATAPIDPDRSQSKTIRRQETS